MVAAGSAVFAIFLQAPRSKLPPIRMGRSLADLRDGEVLAITPVAGSGFVMADSGGYNRAGDIAPAAFVVRMCGKLEVLAASCSHLGCTVDFDTVRQQFVCPCHASRYAAACAAGKSAFAVDGSVLHGPAFHPLAHVGWQPGAKADEILVDQQPVAIHS